MQQPVAVEQQESQESTAKTTFRISRVAVELVIGVGGAFIGFVLGWRFATSGIAMDLAATGQFITSFFDAVAWPVGILVIVLIFRDQIRNKILDITSADIQGTRFEFQRGFVQNIDEANQLAEKIGHQTGAAAGGGGDSEAQLPPRAQQALEQASTLVNDQPKESMIASFEPVKTMILDAAKEKGVYVEPTSSVHEVLKYVSRDIDDDTVEAVKALEHARRDALRIEGPISTEAARRYVDAAQNLARPLLQRMKQ
jgi:hypothetical protein